MRTLGAINDDAAARAEKKRKEHRVWHWCRHRNGFCDQPVWRLVAERLSVPIYQVVAFVNRLEEHANAATPRGYVGDVSPAVFGAALGMPAEDAARIFAELKKHDVAWVDQEHVATFYERNKDDENDKAGAALRSRRSYARRGLRDALEKLVGDELLSAADAGAVIADLEHMGDDELFELDQRRKNGQLAGHLLSTASRFLTREDSSSRVRKNPHDPHASSRVRNVRPHARADATDSDHTGAVDNFSEGGRGESAGSPKGDAAGAGTSPQVEVWLRSEGLRIVIERMNMPRGLAETRLERWVRDLQGDEAGLAAIIEAADAANYTSATFHVSVTEQISRRLKDAQGPRLPLMQSFGPAAAKKQAG